MQSRLARIYAEHMRAQQACASCVGGATGLQLVLLGVLLLVLGLGLVFVAGLALLGQLVGDRGVLLDELGQGLGGRRGGDRQEGLEAAVLGW